MPKPRLVIKGATADEIFQMLRKDEKYKIGVRLYVIYQIANGAASRDLEQIYDVSFKSVCNWVHRFNEKGIDGLKDKPRSGRIPRLNAEQLAQLNDIILNEDPQIYNYNTSTWVTTQPQF
jgi:transposase